MGTTSERSERSARRCWSVSAGTPARMAPAAGGDLGVAGRGPERGAGPIELTEQRGHRRADPVAAGAERAALERLLHQRLGRKARGPGRIHQALDRAGGDGVEPIGDAVVLGGRGQPRATSRRHATRSAEPEAHGQVTVRTDVGGP